MNILTQFWNIFVTSNTFNFAVMLILLGILCKKIDIKKVLSDAVKKVIDTIEQSKAEKQAAKDKLDAANELVKNLGNEIELQLKTAREQGEFLHTNISNDTQKRISNIKENIERVVLSEEKTISTRLSKKTASAAVATAENHIRNILKSSPELHNKYIQESINELDRIKL